MFGFLEAHVMDLKVRSYRLGEAYYCGLCAALGKRYGFLTRALVNYDSTFYAVLIDAQRTSRVKFRRRVCPPRPYRRVTIVDEQESLGFGAAIAMMMLASKLHDDVADGGGLGPKWGLLALRGIFQKARKDLATTGFPAGLILEEWKKQKEIEERSDTDMEACAQPTAVVLSRVFEHTATLAGIKENREVCSRIGHAVGELVFLTDHFLDYSEDLKKGRFNSLAAEARAGGMSPAVDAPPEPVRDRCREICFERLERIKADQGLLQFGWQQEEIVRNVLGMGLPRKIKHIFTCRKQPCKSSLHRPPAFAKFPFTLLGLH